MKITIAKSEKEFDCIAAWRIIGEILNKPESVIGLSTGRTTGNLHRDTQLTTAYRWETH